MPYSKAEKLRKAYEFKLGKKLVSKLSDEQIKLLSKFYNSLSESEQRNIDNRIFKGYSDTELHQMVEGFLQEQETPTVKPKVTTVKSSAITASKLFGEDRYQKYVSELTSEGTIEGKKLTPEERKEGFKKRENKIDFEKFIDKVLRKKDTVESSKKIQSKLDGGGALVPSPKMNIEKFIPPPVTEKTQENLDEILSGIDSILETLREEQKIKKKSEEYDRKKEEKEKRKLQESRLEKRFSGLRKAAEKIIAPVKGILDKILNFFINILLGRIVYKLIDWMADPENKGKINSILRFIKDWWPALLSAYILFGTSFGRFTRSILSTVGKFIFKIGKKAIPQLIQFAAKNPVTAALVAGGALAAGGAYLASQQNERRREEASKSDPTIVTPKETAETGKTPPPSQLQQEYIQQRGLPMFSGGGLNTKNFFGDDEFAGYVSGEKGVDKVPAMLSDGEFVMSTGAVQKYGVQTLEAMNAAGGGTNKPKIMQGVSYAAGGGMIGKRKMIGDNEPPSPEEYGGTPKESTSMMNIPSIGPLSYNFNPDLNFDLNHSKDSVPTKNKITRFKGGGIVGALSGILPGTGRVMAPRGSQWKSEGTTVDKILGITIPGSERKTGYSTQDIQRFNKLHKTRSISEYNAKRRDALSSTYGDYVAPAVETVSKASKDPKKNFVGESFKNFGKNVKTLKDTAKRQEELMRKLGYEPDGYVNLRGRKIEGREGGGSFPIKENTGINIPGGTADRQMIAVHPGEHNYIIPKDSVDRGAVPLINMIVAATDSNSKAYKDGYRTKIPGPPVKSSPKVTVVSSDSSNRNESQPVSVPSGAPSFSASSASRSKVNTLGLINF